MNEKTNNRSTACSLGGFVCTLFKLQPSSNPLDWYSFLYFEIDRNLTLAIQYNPSLTLEPKKLNAKKTQIATFYKGMNPLVCSKTKWIWSGLIWSLAVVSIIKGLLDFAEQHHTQDSHKVLLFRFHLQSANLLIATMMLNAAIFSAPRSGYLFTKHKIRGSQ
jgi:hypothetical protein